MSSPILNPRGLSGVMVVVLSSAGFVLSGAVMRYGSVTRGEISTAPEVAVLRLGEGVSP